MSDEMREKVARRVDSAAWNYRANLLQAATNSDQTNEETRRRWTAQAHDIVQPSLSTADAILSLFTAELERVERERERCPGPPWSWLWSADSLRKVCETPHLCLSSGAVACCGPCGSKLGAMGETPVSREDQSLSGYVARAQAAAAELERVERERDEAREEAHTEWRRARQFKLEVELYSLQSANAKDRATAAEARLAEAVEVMRPVLDAIVAAWPALVTTEPVRRARTFMEQQG